MLQILINKFHKLACTDIHLPKVDFVIHTDASQTGWGAIDGNNPTGGKWLENQEDHMNYL